MLFNSFKDTIFLKKDSELVKQVDALKKLSLKYPHNEKISKDLYFMERGLLGEKEIEFELKNANIGIYVLHDVNMQYQDLKAQIDYIIITPGYVYFVECKNLQGNIMITHKGDFIRKVGDTKTGIYSPLTQAQRHIDIFLKIYNERNNKIMDKLLNRKRERWFKPLVVFANSQSIINLQYAPKDIKKSIVKSDMLIDYIKKDLNSLDKDLLNNKGRMEKMALSILTNYDIKIDRDYETYYEGIYNDSGKLKEKLTTYRINKAQTRNIPTDYIFSDEELEKILEIKPKSLKELEGIISSIKIKYHGKEIVNIITSFT